MSLPHFYGGSSILQEGVIGLHPNKEKHDLMLAFEKNTGLLMDARKRLQVNVMTQGPLNVTGTELWLANMNANIYIPNCWFDVRGTILDSQADEFTSSVYFGQSLAVDSMYTGFILSACLILAAALFFTCSLSRHSQELMDTYQLAPILDN
jgi:hypothetical protein